MTISSRNDGGPFQFVVTTSSELSSIVNPKIGQLALATADGTVWYHTGSAWTAISSGVSAHSALTGLTTGDDHTQYRLESATIDTADITADAVTYAKIQNVSATSRVLGRISSGAGDTEELTAANLKTIIGNAGADQYRMPTGAIAETHPRNQRDTGNNSALTVSGTVLVHAVVLFAGQTAAHLNVLGGASAGSGLTHQYAGLYNTSRQQLAVSADATSTAWTINTVQTFDFLTPYLVPTTGVYYVAMLWTHSAGALPNLWYTSPGSGNAAMFGLPPIVVATSSTSQTSLPDPLGAFVALNNLWYAYVT